MVAFSPDGATAAAASRDSVLRLWDVRSMQPLALVEEHVDVLNAMTFDEHGALISAGADGLALVWDLDPAHAVRELCEVLDRRRSPTSGGGSPPTWATRPPCTS